MISEQSLDCVESLHLIHWTACWYGFSERPILDRPEGGSQWCRGGCHTPLSLLMCVFHHSTSGSVSFPPSRHFFRSFFMESRFFFPLSFRMWNWSGSLLKAATSGVTSSTLRVHSGMATACNPSGLLPLPPKTWTHGVHCGLVRWLLIPLLTPCNSRVHQDDAPSV